MKLYISGVLAILIQNDAQFSMLTKVAEGEAISSFLPLFW